MADTETHISASRTIDASAKDLFDVLTLPAKHAQLDGSGFIRSDDRTQRITATGQTFRMNMDGPHMGGEYQTENHVIGFAPDKLIAWQTAPAGTEPPGWEWIWRLEAQGPNSTDVSVTYDWGKVTDKELLRKITFPLVPKEALEHSLATLAEVVSGT